MGINQAIYTSSARGISKGGGLGIHTYSYSCSTIELKEFELSYCRYDFSGDADKIPELPVKVLYGKTETGRYLQSLVTYLGKDYDKSSGRMGNILSHMYSFDKEDIALYPMQLYGSSDYRTYMETEEVDGTKDVEYLPEAGALKAGDIITVNSVQDFLDDARMEMLCHLISAVLKQDSSHKIIIYDTHENILMWLGAIGFSLPLQCAKELTFSSYEKNPMLSEFHIRGAVAEMSDGTCDDYNESGQFYVFDGINNEYPKFDISTDYYEYGIKMGLAFSYDAIVAFFDFMKKYNYERITEEIYFAFNLFQMCQGGIIQLSEKGFKDAILFETKYGNKKSYKEMLVRLAGNLGSDTSNEKFFENVRMLLSEYYKKELNKEELSFILAYTIQFENYVKNNKGDMQANKIMRQKLYQIMFDVHREKLFSICEYLFSKKEYKRLGELEAYIFYKLRADILNESKECNFIREVDSIFKNYWIKIPEKYYVYFDVVIEEVVKVLKSYKDSEEKYLIALNLYLHICELGKGFITGSGCEQLISIIENGTNITAKNQLKKREKNKEEKDALEKKQTLCAFEVFNYTERNKVNLPIAKIRLHHLKICIAKAFEEKISMLKSKTLKIYEEFPVFVEHVNDEDFKKYIENLAEIINTLENSKEEYFLLLTLWALDKEQKEIVINAFMEYEVLDCLKRKKSIRGLKALLNAIRELKDNEYYYALEKYIYAMKASNKKKIAEAIYDNYDNDLYRYWMKLC